MPIIEGLDIDEAGRCRHYHQSNDVAALKCGRCQRYFACYRCHDALTDHAFVPCDPNDAPVMCGHCHHVLTRAQYERGRCPVCQHPFNPKCARHATIYFKT